MDALRLRPAIVAGYDWGGRAACVAAALRPDRVRGLVSIGGYNVQDIASAGVPLVPEQEHRFWYQYYLHGERGALGLASDRRAFCRLLWRLWSPTWDFGEPTFERSAASFDNPDFVEVVVHSYRHRFGLAADDPAYSEIERALAGKPVIRPSTIVLHGGSDGVDPAEMAEKNLDRFDSLLRRTVSPGIGHNVPQESPGTVAEAVWELASRT